MRKLFCILILPAVLAAGAKEVPAELTEEQADSLARSFALEEFVVTGTRTRKALKDTPIQTRLITEEEIRLADASTVQDLLQTELPGLEFSYAMNQQVNMNLGGFSGQNVLVLLDGERLAGETMENTDLSRLDMNGISRVEIIRGAASALYGSNAAGGVVNLISRDADAPWRVNLNARAGAHGEWRLGGTASSAGKWLSNVFEASLYRISTYDVCLNQTDECDFRKVYGYRTCNFRDRLTWTPCDALRVTGKLGYYFKERQYNPDTPDRYRDFTGGLRAAWEISERDALEASYNFDQYDKSDFIKHYGLDVRDYRNVQHSLKALYSHSFRASDILTVGGDFRRDYLESYQFEEGAAYSQLTADLFAQYDWNIDTRWELVGAVRWDYFSDGSKSRLTGKLSGRYRLGSLTLRAGYAGGFRAPTLKEKYMNFDMADIFDIHGNPDLKPERSHNFNFSAEYLYRNYYFAAGANYNLVSDRIATSGIRYTQTQAPYLDYINVPRLRVFGVDASVRARWTNGLSASVNYNFTHEGYYKESANQYCPARPHSLTAKCGWNRRWSRHYATTLTLSGRFLSKVSYTSIYLYEPFEERRVTNPAYTLWKLQLSQDIWRGITLTMAVDNLFNYTPAVYAFNAPVTSGATFQVGLTLEIDKFGTHRE